MFYVIRKPEGISKEESGQIDRHLNISFYQQKEDWYSEEIYFSENRTIKRCQPEDFGDDE